jgi:hypothetical protein
VPPEPPIDLDSDYDSEYTLLKDLSQMTPDYGASSDGTQDAILQNSLNYMTKGELDALEAMLNDTKPYDMRDSVKFLNEKTRARISA